MPVTMNCFITELEEAMIYKERKIAYGAVFLAALIILLLTGCGNAGESLKQEETSPEEYIYIEYPLERNGVELHLDCVSIKGKESTDNILLVHGVTYSSHEFDINYEDYSLVRMLAREGYAVWRIDIAGFGQSEEVTDGFMPDSDYALEDIHAAAEKIIKETGNDKVDVLGWSWGTVTAGRFAVSYPGIIDKLVLYAPILSGIGEYEISEAFHHNTWEHAAEDFQKESGGSFDLSVVDPVIIDMFCSSCWRYDGEHSPNGGRRDICVDGSVKLIDLDGINNPTMVICGDKDPYLNYELVNESLEHLPEGSALKIIPGGSHVVYIEKPYYHEFQDALREFLE